MTMTCVPEKNKRIFATRVEAEEFEKRNRATFGNQQQYAYDCPHGDHVHLSSSPSSVAGAPQIKTTDWSKAKARWQVVEPQLPAISRGDKGKRPYGRMAPQPPVITLQNVRSQRERLEAELKRLDEQEKAIREREEEKRRVIVKVASNGNNSATMIFAFACGKGIWLTAEQGDSLLAQLPGVIEDMKSRQEAAGAVAGQ